MKKLASAMMMVAGAMVVHVAMTACGGAESSAKASGDEITTVSCDGVATAKLELKGMTASDIAFGVKAFGHYKAGNTTVPGVVGEQRPVLAGEGVAVVTCDGFASVDFQH